MIAHNRTYQKITHKNCQKLKKRMSNPTSQIIIEGDDEPPPLLDCQEPLGKSKTILTTTFTQIEDRIAKLKKKEIHLTSNEIAEIQEVSVHCPLRISNYYLSLIKEKNNPIWNQCIPNIKEITDIRGDEDPLNEESPIPFLTHRYPDRALLLVSNTCAMFCRFCTRKRKVGYDSKNPTMDNLKPALDYIKKHKEIRDIILSGGDPLMLKDKNIEWILQEIRNIDHIEIIRIGSRVPCVLPERITPALCEILKKYNTSPALYINTHFEHPDEITPSAKKACEMITDVGIPLGNQSIVLKGINDNPKTYFELNQKLLAIKVRPYYIYQADLVKGTYHFIAPIQTGLDIIQGLRGHTSGLAVPQFVIDAPGGGGKNPLIPEYVHINEDKSTIITNYQGKQFNYPKIE